MSPLRPETFTQPSVSVLASITVNENGGTANAARLDRGDYVICGKTGSAQTSRRVLERDYLVRLSDEEVGRRAPLSFGMSRGSLG